MITVNYGAPIHTVEVEGAQFKVWRVEHLDHVENHDRLRRDEQCVCGVLGVGVVVDGRVSDVPLVGVDGTPEWAYDDDGYCVCCGNGRWKHHMPDCRLRDALDALDLEEYGWKVKR